jgi:CRP/FNR family transcriptional regulator
VDVRDVLALPVFRRLDEADAVELVDQARFVELTAGEVLFRRGQPGSALYFLVSGRIEILAADDAMSDHRLATLDAGAILGEIAVLIDAPRTATAVALADSRLAQIERASFDAALGAHCRWAVVLLRTIACVLAERLSTVDRRLLSLIAAEGPDEAAAVHARVAELEQLRRRLLSDWHF